MLEISDQMEREAACLGIQKNSQSESVERKKKAKEQEYNTMHQHGAPISAFSHCKDCFENSKPHKEKENEKKEKLHGHDCPLSPKG